MTNIIERHWLPATLALLMLFVTVNAGEQFRKMWVNSTAAIEWQGVEVITREVEPGGELSIAYTAQINRTCPADLRGFLVAPDGTVPVRYPVVAGGYTKPTPEPVRIQVRVTIPKMADGGLGAMKPGQYVYRTVATRYCADGMQDDTEIPDANFTLTEKKE